MYPLQEQFKSDALAQLNSQMLQAGRIAGNLLEIGHQIGVLNARTGKASAEALTGAVQKLLAANNPVEFFQLAATVMRPVPQVWTDYAQQLRGIAGKIVTPVTPDLAKAAAEMPAAPAAEPDPQDTAPPAALDAGVPESAPPAAAPVPAVAGTQSEAQALPAAASSAAQAAPEVPQAVQEVTQAINNVAKAAPLISAAAAPDAKTLAKSAVVPKAAVKASRARAVQKGAPAGKQAGRARKS